MDDKTRAKELAKAHRAAMDELCNPMLMGAERSRLRERKDSLSMKLTDHQAATGWSYEVPDYPGELGRWKHTTSGFWTCRTEWIDDEKETEQ